MNKPIQTDMHLVVVVLRDASLVDSLVLSITSIGGTQVTVLDAVSGTDKLTQTIPMFAEFLGLSGSKLQKVLIACVPHHNPVAHLLDVLDEGGIHFIEKNLGEIYAFPLSGAVLNEPDAEGF